MDEIFVLPASYRKKLLSTVGTLTRSFRNNLALIYFKDDNRNWIDDPPQDPPENYPQISPEQWTAFVNHCYSEEHQALSAQNRDRAKLQTTLYVKGRLGYVGAKEELLKDKAKNLPPGAPIPDRIPRHELFLLCRQMPDGSYDSEKWPVLKEVAERIGVLKQRQEMGELIPTEDGPHDILSQALNKPKHHGRLRGLGFGVLKKDYFSPDQYSTTQEVQQLRSEVGLMRKELAELRFQRTQQFQYSQPHQFQQSARAYESAHFNQYPQFTQYPHINQSPQFTHSPPFNQPPHFPSPCHTPYGSPQPISEGIFTCELALREPWYRVVALAKVFNDDNPIHNHPVPEGFVKVGPDIIYEGEWDTRLPVPNEDGDLFVLGNSLDIRILWPCDLVVNVQVDVNASKRRKQPAIPQQKGGRLLTLSSSNFKKERVPQNLKQLWIATKARLAGSGDLIEIDMPKLLFESIMAENIGMEEIKHVIKQQEIGAIIISTYIRCVLYDSNRPLYGFISPHRVGPNTLIPPIEQSQYMSVRFMSGMQHKDMMWFVPYNAG